MAVASARFLSFGLQCPFSGLPNSHQIRNSKKELRSSGRVKVSASGHRLDTHGKPEHSDDRLHDLGFSGFNLRSPELYVIGPGRIGAFRTELVNPEQLHHEAFQMVVDIGLREVGGLNNLTVAVVCVRRETSSF